MKIGYFTDTYDPKIDGVVFSLHQFEDELRKRGHEIHIFAPVIKPGYHDIRPDVHRFRSVPTFLYPEIRLGLPNVPRLLRELPKLKLDLLHSHTPILGPLAEYASGRLGVPHVHTYHTMIDEYVAIYVPGVKKWNKQLMQQINRTFLNRTDHVVAPSPKIEAVLKELGVTTPIEVIPTGVRLEEFTGVPRGKFRHAHRIPASDPIVVYVGRIAEEKNIAQLARAFRELLRAQPTAHLVIGGTGPYLEELKSLVAELGIDGETILPGYLERTDVSSLLADANLFVFPSLTDTQGLVLLEAAASSLPLIVCEPEIAVCLRVGENGLVAKNSPSDLAAQMKTILSDPERAATMGKLSRTLSEEFTAEIQATKMEALYRRLTEGR